MSRGHERSPEYEVHARGRSDELPAPDGFVELQDSWDEAALMEVAEQCSKSYAVQQPSDLGSTSSVFDPVVIDTNRLLPRTISDSVLTWYCDS